MKKDDQAKTSKPKPQNPDSATALLEQQIGELTEALQRERADVTNVRRRHEQQMAGLKNAIKAQVVRDLLPVVDNFERALKHVPEAPSLESRVSSPDEYTQKLEEYIKGVNGLVKQFEKTLADLGVERIKTIADGKGEPFDPRYHEAVSMEEGDGVTEVVSEELQAGYKIGDEVIRHAMVRVKMQ
jgi:molecular chaperone GrpE